MCPDALFCRRDRSVPLPNRLLVFSLKSFFCNISRRNFVSWENDPSGFECKTQCVAFLWQLMDRRVCDNAISRDFFYFLPFAAVIVCAFQSVAFYINYILHCKTSKCFFFVCIREECCPNRRCGWGWGRGWGRDLWRRRGGGLWLRRSWGRLGGGRCPK
jgi:hypothetical protein